ncbi:uncharacterized protein [Miscanthus floridulus]|uniref:uncharacterized protein n=1 Tax=Miscanthus floridulus TaxID=154761 RepID=UPI0034582146
MCKSNVVRSAICVHVYRKWEYCGGTDDGPIQHVDLVLLVEKVFNSMVTASMVRSQANGIYVISRFRVSNAKSGYRPVDSPYMVEFTPHTTISVARTDMPGFPKYAYKITPIDALSAHAGDTKNFLGGFMFIELTVLFVLLYAYTNENKIIDTIEILVEVSEAYRVRLPNKLAPTLTRHFVLRDLSYSEMKITLWGHRAAAFTTNGVYNRNEAKPIIVLFVGGLMKFYQDTTLHLDLGNYNLSANAASRWYFNPPIPEARQFHGSLQGQRLEIRFVPVPREENGQAQAPAQRAEKTLRELNEMDPNDFADNGYRCTVTIGRLTPNVSWWFPSCSKSCVPDGAGYRCNACSNTSFKFKYKISFVALDGTDEAEMICFGDVARRIIGKTVQQLLRTSPHANTYPLDVTKIVSLRFTFAVALTQQSYYWQQNLPARVWEGMKPLLLERDWIFRMTVRIRYRVGEGSSLTPP